MENKIWLREGMKVVHVTNKDFEMTVERLCYRFASIICDENEDGAYYNSELHSFVKSKKILIGVICRWMNSEGMLQNAEFHSRELIPVLDERTESSSIDVKYKKVKVK